MEEKKAAAYGFKTRAVHTGNAVDQETGAIKRPITMANSYAFPYDPTDVNWSSASGNLYTRNGGANDCKKNMILIPCWFSGRGFYCMKTFSKSRNGSMKNFSKPFIFW